jgi:heme/copper-type cytochrome/quinol oxidase subunit 1
MILKKTKAYHLFLIVSILILLIGMYRNTDPNSGLDINIHATYFVISNYDSTLVLFTTYFLTGLLYWLFEKLSQKQLVKPLTIIHTIILIGSFVLYWLVIIYSKIFLSNPTFPMFDNGSQLINATLVIDFLLILFLAVPIFIINLLIGLIRRI